MLAIEIVVVSESFMVSSLVEQNLGCIARWRQQYEVPGNRSVCTCQRLIQDFGDRLFVVVQSHGSAREVRHNGEVIVLLVEDDPSIAKSVISSLETAGLDVRHVATGQAAIDSVAQERPDVVLMDLGLPDMDGLDASKTIRSTSSVPIIIVSARGDELDRILGLELGADDYVVKPFSQRELLARIRAVTRRGGDSHDAPEINRVVGSTRLVVNEREHTVKLDGVDVVLTAKEFELLAYLASEPGTVFRRNDILEHVWDVNWFGTTKTLDAHIASIRKKLGSPDWIQAVRGVGFKFVEVSE